MDNFFIRARISTYFGVVTVVTSRLVAIMERGADVHLANFLKTHIVGNFRQNPRFMVGMEKLYSPIYYLA